MQKISFNFNILKWEGITIDQVKLWEEAFPDCDVVDILTKKMPVWMDANPLKAHKKNFKRFIIGWLSRQQDRYSQFRKEKT
jgi:hypothetical protein